MKYNQTELGRSDKLLAATECEWLLEWNTISVKESNSRFHIVWARIVYLPVPEHLSSQLQSPSQCGCQSREASSSAALSSVSQICNLSRLTGEGCGGANLSYGCCPALLSCEATFVGKWCWFIQGRDLMQSPSLCSRLHSINPSIGIFLFLSWA